MSPPAASLRQPLPAMQQDDGRPLADGIIDQAIHWYVLRASGEMSPDDETALQSWCAAHPDHALAWARLHHMGEHLRRGPDLPSDLARGTLARLGRTGRRRALGHLLWIGAAGSLLWLGRDPLRDAVLPAQFHTAVGERRVVTLADGTLLRLNTATSVDVRYDQDARRILLREGEIEVTTAADPAGRPLWVEARDARLMPVGTRFSVLQAPAHTHLAVREGAVDVRMRDDAVERIAAGQQARFTQAGEITTAALDDSRQAWVDGMLVAVNRRLDRLLIDLSRHRPGHLRWSPEVAALRVTGTWPLDGDRPTDAVLESLERRLPIRVRYLTRYWVSVEAR
ncbi:FecR domain-containing protein [Pseudothauera nasutitermitis]|nr:FecR domain-containing protein [Pseudothauera nasutitermitis]